MFSRTLTAATLAAIVSLPPAFAAAQETSVRGAITEVGTDRIVVRTSSGDKVVMIGEGTNIAQITGAGVLRRKARGPEDLMRGLAVEVEAVPASAPNSFMANSITFRKDDLRTAEAIDAGVQGERARIEEAERRLDNVGELEAAGRTKVFFETGKADISAQGRQDLQAIAAQAKQIKGGYRLAVVGRADPRGNAAANERLSSRRAAAVMDYLAREAGVRPGSVLPQTALGASHVADDPDPPKSLAEGRRVTVTILVSKANTSVARASAP